MSGKKKKRKKKNTSQDLPNIFHTPLSDKEVCWKIILQQSFSHGISCVMSLSSNFPMLYKPDSDYRFFQ